MKILVVSPNIPYPMAGASTRNYHILKALASKHSVSLLALDESSSKGISYDTSLVSNLTRSMTLISCSTSLPKRWQQLLGAISGRPYILHVYHLPEMQKAIDTLLASERYDAVLFESMFMAGYHLPEGIKVIIDQHNLEFEVRLRTFQREKGFLRKWYNWYESRLLKPVEIERCRQADAVLVTSERERLALKRVLPRRVVEVVANGVDVEYFHGSCLEQLVENRIVFTGAMDYYPNMDAALFFAQHCWPLIREQIPTATWQIVGKNPPPQIQKLAALPGVSVTGSVTDVRPYIASAAVSIAPLLIGSGTRLKILEAFAMQKAVVTTSIGCEGLAVETGTHLLVEDQPDSFAKAVISLLNDAEKRNSLGSAGRALVENTYSWGRCGTHLLHILEGI